jgi:thiamine kinase-like enzyme
MHQRAQLTVGGEVSRGSIPAASIEVQDNGRPRVAGVRETKAVSIPLGDGVFSSAWLSSVLEDSPHWPHGALRVLKVSRIGTEHGLSGQIHRVVAETKHGGSRSFVVKQESAAAVGRELLFRSHCGGLVRGCIPDLFCGVTDAGAERGVLVLEDITPAEQGDVLHGCTDDEAGAVVRVLARLHGGSWNVTADATAGVPRWSAQPMEPDRWRDRLARATERFPGILERIVEPLVDVPERVADAGSLLSQGPASWLHVDAHLDNTLLRPDGTVVLLDWCNAAIGPPAIDLARFLIEGVVESSQPERVTALLSIYANELRAGVEGVALSELETGFELALLPLVQGAVGWAGRHELEQNGRSAALCENFLRSACGWALRDESGSQHGGKAP